MGKIVPLNSIPAIVKQCQIGGGRVGLITGCFDVLHIGHIKLFKWAKKRVDLLIVGLDSDGSIRLSKGAGRPVFTQKVRLEVISELSSVDYVFGIRKVLDFSSISANSYYSRLVRKIASDYLISNLAKDRYIYDKLERIRSLGIKALVQRECASTSSTEVVEKIKRLG